eukprot:2570862-Rhodomonas_salina.3
MESSLCSYEEGNEHPLFCRISREDFEGAISLSACYAMSGTELAHLLSVRSCYAKSGTELAYPVISLRASYAMSGTERVFAATRRVVPGQPATS